jgi:hypothetical protein
MPLKVEIQSDEVNERSGKFDDGRPWTSRQQRAYVSMPGEPYPIAVDIKLGKEAPYPKGVYLISPDSFRVYKGKLELSPYLRLQVMPAATRAAG